MALGNPGAGSTDGAEGACPRYGGFVDESPHARSEHVTYERDTHTKWGHKNPGGLWWMALLAVPLLHSAAKRRRAPKAPGLSI